MRVAKAEWTAMKNRLEYLKDKADRQDEELAKYRNGLNELQLSLQIVLKEVALKYGGPDHKIELEHGMDIGGWKAVVSNDDEKLTIELEKKEGD